MDGWTKNYEQRIVIKTKNLNISAMGQGSNQSSMLKLMLNKLKLCMVRFLAYINQNASILSDWTSVVILLNSEDYELCRKAKTTNYAEIQDA